MSIISISCSVVASAESGSKLFHIDLQSVVDELPKGWVDNLVKEMTGPGWIWWRRCYSRRRSGKISEHFPFLGSAKIESEPPVDENWTEIRRFPIWTISRSAISKSWDETLDQIDRGWHFLKFGTVVFASEPDQQRNRHIFHDGHVSPLLLLLMPTRAIEITHRLWLQSPDESWERLGDQVCAPLPSVLRFICTSIFSRHRNDAMPHGGLKSKKKMTRCFTESSGSFHKLPE